MAKHERLLELAIRGLKAELAELEIEFAAISKGVVAGVKTLTGRKPKPGTPRKTISLAQKAYWAKRAGGKEKIIDKTLKLSDAARQKMSEAAKRRWANYRSEKK